MREYAGVLLFLLTCFLNVISAYCNNRWQQATVGGLAPNYVAVEVHYCLSLLNYSYSFHTDSTVSLRLLATRHFAFSWQLRLCHLGHLRHPLCTGCKLEHCLGGFPMGERGHCANIKQSAASGGELLLSNRYLITFLC